MSKVGRPRGTTTAALQQRTRTFIRLIASGQDFDTAAHDARLQPVRALAILSQPEVRQLISVDREAA